MYNIQIKGDIEFENKTKEALNLLKIKALKQYNGILEYLDDRNHFIPLGLIGR